LIFEERADANNLNYLVCPFPTIPKSFQHKLPEVLSQYLFKMEGIDKVIENLN
jgi:hypothetical protein